MSFEKNTCIQVTLLVLRLSCFSVLISFLLSFLIGAVLLSDKYFGNPYMGAVLFYFWCAIPIVLIMPLVYYRRLNAQKIGRIFLISIGSGALFSFFSLLAIHLYLRYMEYFPISQSFRVGIAVKYDDSSLLLLGALFSASILLIGLFARFKSNIKE